jgi:DNA-binding protein HU-beta
MTKAEIVAEIAKKTGIEKGAVQTVVENFMEVIKHNMVTKKGKERNVYLRGFGSFIVKERAEKTGRNISKNVAITIPAHNIPAFKPAKTFMNVIK